MGSSFLVVKISFCRTFLFHLLEDLGNIAPVELPVVEFLVLHINVSPFLPTAVQVQSASAKVESMSFPDFSISEHRSAT